jgi:hypothetical protein
MNVIIIFEFVKAQRARFVPFVIFSYKEIAQHFYNALRIKYYLVNKLIRMFVGKELNLEVWKSKNT